MVYYSLTRYCYYYYYYYYFNYHHHHHHTVLVVPCHHGMARPQFTDRGTTSDKEGSWE